MSSPKQCTKRTCVEQSVTRSTYNRIGHTKTRRLQSERPFITTNASKVASTRVKSQLNKSSYHPLPHNFLEGSLKPRHPPAACQRISVWRSAFGTLVINDPDFPPGSSSTLSGRKKRHRRLIEIPWRSRSFFAASGIIHATGISSLCIIKEGKSKVFQYLERVYSYDLPGKRGYSETSERMIIYGDRGWMDYNQDRQHQGLIKVFP